MTDLAVIILAKNEKLHIGRCLEKLAPLEAKQIFVVDCFSDDGTQEISRRMGAIIVEHKWPGLYAKQFNWALDNLPIEASWILRLDADEYLFPDTIKEVKNLLSQYVDGKATESDLPSDVTSLSLCRARAFCGRRIHFGDTAHIPMVRFFKYRIGRCEDRAMDEHIITSEGRDYRLKGEFVDDNLNSMDWWREKHRGYARREAADALAFERGEIHFKEMKEKYYRMPRYLRAFAYFFIRYFLRGGFLDGYAGWMWHFWQGLWYRCLVDREIGRLKKETFTCRRDMHSD
ncbi:MAG: glycosyltransferase family 2 protein [Victivallales bacterium]|nr:glycosyltransferase family 2 protein [Victivallales bacterium]